ncbi:MAG: trypsin-like peptidase domain-containing protein [Bauldia sp.]|nr:trypsin-like peptidase domain-containing protein [Bauldia sp.]
MTIYATYPTQPNRPSQFSGNMGPGGRDTRTVGSGVVVDASGVVVTNYHLVDDAVKIEVMLPDGHEVDADLLLLDRSTDLAVIRLAELTTEVQPLELGNSDEVHVGDLVLAIGNPFGLGQTVTSGIISAMPRTQVGAAERQMFLQTDAAVNPGNSGGALIDMEGRVVGINSAIYSRTGGSIGIAFAIPSNLVRTFVQSAMSGERVPRPWLAAAIDSVPRDMATELGFDRPRGVLVNAVTEGGPVATAGILPGDLILEVDGVGVSDPGAFDYYTMVKGIGETVSVGVLRGETMLAFDLDLIRAPETVPRDEVQIAGRSPFAGVTVANLSPAVAVEVAYHGESNQGVIVVGVITGSPAARAGLRVGDLIMTVDGAAIDVTKALIDATTPVKRSWQYVVEREGRILRLLGTGI